MKGWIERSGFHIEQLAGPQSNGLADSVSVLRTPLQCLENKKIQSPLQYLNAALISRFHDTKTLAGTSTGANVSKT
jgi:hypothetical protein